MMSVALFDHDVPNHSSEALRREVGRFGRFGDRGWRHDYPCNDNPLLALVGMHRAVLMKVESKPQISATYVLDPGKTRCEDILDDDHFDERNVVAVHTHCSLPQKQELSLQGQCEASLPFYASAPYWDSAVHYAIAEYAVPESPHCVMGREPYGEWRS